MLLPSFTLKNFPELTTLHLEYGGILFAPAKKDTSDLERPGLELPWIEHWARTSPELTHVYLLHSYDEETEAYFDMEEPDFRVRGSARCWVLGEVEGVKQWQYTSGEAGMKLTQELMPDMFREHEI